MSCDPVAQAELDGELSGGPKQHSMNAALIYGIDAADAKTHLVPLKGQMRPAYDAGKRQTHRWNYGGGPKNMSQTFWLPLKFCKDVDAKLRAKYARTVEWRREIADQVFGLYEYSCHGCGYTSDEGGTCPLCIKRGLSRKMKFVRAVQDAERMYRTPFGRIRHYPGNKGKGANALASQPAQSSGASLWYRTLIDMHDPDIPGPSDRFTWRMGDPFSALFTPAVTFIATGTYDSFLVECPTVAATDVLQWLLWHMEVPRMELGGRRFPAEGMIGFNWEKYDEVANPGGLKVQDIKAFSSRNPYAAATPRLAA
jgi:hypothetical protein